MCVCVCVRVLVLWLAVRNRLRLWLGLLRVNNLKLNEMYESVKGVIVVCLVCARMTGNFISTLLQGHGCFLWHFLFAPS